MARRRLWRRPVVREERVPPTPETAAKLVPDSLIGIAPDLQQAAALLAFGWRVLTTPARLKIASVERIGGRKLTWSPAESDAVERFKRWCREMRRRRLDNIAVVAICVDGAQPWQMDEIRGWPQGRAAEMLIEGLTVFAEG